MMVKTKTTLITLILTLSAICNVFLPLSSFNNTLPNAPYTYHTALAFKPTNPKQPPIVNHPPIANVGPDQTVNESSKVTLVGVAIDPDPNDKLSYSWMTDCRTSCNIKRSNTSSPTFTAPSNVPSDTQLKFALTAKDDKGAESNNPCHCYYYSQAYQPPSSS